MPQDYLDRVRRTHERGGYGSTGCGLKELSSPCAHEAIATASKGSNSPAVLCRYGSYWRTSEAEKNLLRTHTTAVSSRMLYRLAQEVQRSGTFRPAKYFSIDRVFRNEAIDRTHLAEFHQIEGAYVLSWTGCRAAAYLFHAGCRLCVGYVWRKGFTLGAAETPWLVAGVVCDRGLTLGDLIGTLHLFFTRLGLPKLRFKPAYNPYTEPSMEIFR